MLNGSAPRICAKISLLILLLLAISAPSRAQFVSFAEFAVPTANSIPGCIVHGPDGALWFTETTEFSNKIGRATTDGTITEYPIPTAKSGPYCITPGPDGALWFTESTGNNIGRITTGGVITEYPIPTANAGPLGIVGGPDGAMWFTESTAGKIGRVDDGTITEFTIPTSASYPVGITAGSDGALWFTEGTGNKIGQITLDGVVTEFALRRRNSSPWGITAGPDGALWFTEQTSSTIGRITVAGAINEFAVPTTGSIPWGITTGPDGALWFTERKGNKVARISTAGTFSEYAIPEVPGNPFGISVGSDGALWLTDDGPNSIIRAALVAQPPSLSIFTTPPIANASVGVYYSKTLSGTGGTPPYTWAVSAGSLPTGLALGSTTGAITGLPTSSGLASFTVQITDATGATATEAFSMVVQANPISQFPLPLTYRFGGITKGPDGALWFTESTSGPNTNYVGRITTAGVVTEYPAAAPCDCDGLNGITSGPDGALWFAAGTGIGQITTGGTVTEYPVPNAISIDGITTGPDGALWFTDDFSNYIGRITTAGAVTQFQVPAHGDSNGIYSIATGPDGALWFTEAAGYIGRITTAGAVTEFPVLAVPVGITAGPEGALWFTDANGAVGEITTAGAVTEYPTPTVSNLLGITVGPDGALWFTEPTANKIGRVMVGGSIIEYPIPSADAGLPGYITSGPDGALWFTQDGRGEGGSGAIGRLLPAPTLTGINPSSGGQGSSVRVLLTGTSFVSDGTSVNVPAGITLTNFTFISPTQVAVTLTIAPSAPTGPVNITVSTPSGVSGPVTFTITPPPPPPVLTSITPATGVQGTSVAVDLAGANFVAGPTIVGTNFPTDFTQLVPLTQTATLIDNGRLSVTATVYPDPSDTASQWVDFNFQSVNGGALAANADGFWQVYLSNIPLTKAGSFTGAQYYWTINGTAAPNIAAIPGLYPVITNLINPALGSAYGSIFEGGTPLSFMDVFAQLGDYATGLHQGGMDSQAINGFHIAARTTGGVFGPATILVSNPGVTVSNVNLVSATEITAVLNIATNATLGPANVTVSTPLGTSAPVTFIVLPPPPTLTSISPSAGTAGRTIHVTLTGTNFIAGGTNVTVTGGVSVSNVTVASGIQLTADFSIPADATPGPADVTVGTAGGTAGPLSFTIDAVPSITTSTLPVGVVGTPYSSGIFVSGGTPPYNWAVTAGALPAGLSLDPATCSDPPAAPFQRANLAGHVSKGNRPLLSRQSAAMSCLIVGTPTTYIRSTFTLQVTDSSGARAKKALVLTVNPPPPTVSSINPATGVQGTTLTVSFAGTNFVPGTTLFLNNPGLMASNIVAVSPTYLTATLTIAAAAALGGSDIVVTTPGGAASPVLFTVLPPPPVLSSITPVIGTRGSTVSVTISGTGFTPGVTIAIDTAGITVSSLVVVSPNLITATLIIANDVAAGPVHVTVVSSSGASGAVTFTISPLQLTSISPATGAAGTSVPVTLAGAGFGTDSQVASSSTDVTVNNVTVVNSSQITATLNIAPAAAQGPVKITVTSGGVTSAPVTFAIGHPNPATLTSISPAFAAQGSTTSVTLTGTGFVAGARIGTSNTGVTASNIVVVSATQITATFTIAADTAPGPVNVTVTTPGGSSSPVVFTILAPLTLSSISPAAGAQGASVPITLTGTGFATGAQVSVSTPGVAAGSVVVVNSTQITATLTIDAAAATGTANVTVTLGGATSAAVVFTINPPKPTLTSISAAGAPQGTSVAVTLTGANFITGATVAFGNSGITATDVVVSSATKITATLSIGADAVLGGTTATVSTAGGASGPVNFTVKPAVNFTVTGLPDSLPSGQQVPFTVSIGEGNADDLSANLTIEFTPGQSLPPDPTVGLPGGTCSSNGSIVTCTMTFQIAAHDTSAALSLQTGTVSGTVAFNIDHVSVGGVAVTLSNNPPTNASVTPQPPVITEVAIQPLASGFNIVVTGFSNTRDITEADFTFTPTSGSQLQTSTFALTNVAGTFQTYYVSDASTAVGSEFVYTQLFNLTAGSIGTLQSVSVSLKNAQGASSAMTAHF